MSNSRFDQLWADDYEFYGEISPDLSFEQEQVMMSSPWLDHRPGSGYPRSDLNLEASFADAWEKYMRSTEVPNYKLWKIVKPFYGLPNQDAATLFATIFCWLGTNVGQGMMDQADHGAYLGSGMVMRWGKENLRVDFINHGYGIIDHLIRGIGWSEERVTLDLYRSTFELMRFLDSHEGRLLIEYAQAQPRLPIDLEGDG